ncbi:MAG TPA: penicillin acylase family protein [Gemmatimonadaceae bacterium]|nr:penicillin acylase family protein [Gemmatimonadaceae bacterium]
MKRRVFLLLAAVACGIAPFSLEAQNADVARWEQRARNVTIIRDDWGIPHVYGRTDADAVFGVMYAQAEDDFNRVESNYIVAMGRAAEAEGERAIFTDLRMKLFITPDSLKAMYARSPQWLKALMDAYADGLNFYLYKNPQVKPKVITRFEPWMALSFSEGSIGGDIERVSVPRLRAFYDTRPAPRGEEDEALSIYEEPRGSNGFAIAPKNSKNNRALLLINPHTSFFFRAEAQMVSEEGLNAYGAITWGQFFIYQGFNDRAGWMHTSSSVDNIDEYFETIIERDGKRFYRYGNEERPVIEQMVSVPYRTANGMATRRFTVYRTHHGPIVRAEGDKWIAVRLMEEPLKALQQSYLRTKARNLGEFRKTMDLHTNSSNNTIFADAEGNIAYFHANFVPRRDTSFDWTRPVEGSNPATEWKGVHGIDETPLVVNPATGWLYNTNNWPYSAAGESSPKRTDYPRYVDAGSENPRGLHAIRVLKDKKDFDIASLRNAAYDTYLTAFEVLLPPLIRDYDAAPASHPLKSRLAEQIAVLRSWDYRWSEGSVPTALAIYWADDLQQHVARSASQARMSSYDYAIQRASADERLQALSRASDSLASQFGRWQTPWGEINRFQRLTGDIVHTFNDAAPSIPVGFPSARWGSLASFGARPYPNTKKWYGTSGNSFVAVVEFGRDSVRAIAVTAGGQSGDPKSKHFNDQARRYSTGDLRPVYFYRPQLAGHIEREYRPGER